MEVQKRVAIVMSIRRITRFSLARPVTQNHRRIRDIQGGAATYTTVRTAISAIDPAEGIDDSANGIENT